MSQFRALYEQAPDSAFICYQLGLGLLRAGDDEGVALIERAIERDDGALLAGAQLLRNYYARSGRDQEAQYWHGRWLQRAQILHAAQTERSSIHPGDKFEPHGLDDAQIATLRAQLFAIPGVYRAYLVRKHLALLADRPLLVLGFTTTPWWHIWRNAKRTREVQDNREDRAFPA